MRVFSPAKINIGLKVFQRRPSDGYHYIQSIFVPISFGDVLEIQKASKDSITSKSYLCGNSRKDFEAISERGQIKKNLLWRVLEATQKLRSNCLRVHLIKHIPLGSGLGGASSNAGVLLRYISQFYLQKTLPTSSNTLPVPSHLNSLAIQLGADVPFFLQKEPQFVTGIGDRLIPISIGSGLGILALTGISIPTAQAYTSLKRTLHTTSPLEAGSQLETGVRIALKGSLWKGLRNLQNDFETTLFSRYPILKELKDNFLRGGADYALLSGSGSSIYALVTGSKRQTDLQRKMEEIFPECRFINFSF